MSLHWCKRWAIQCKQCTIACNVQYTVYTWHNSGQSLHYIANILCMVKETATKKLVTSIIMIMVGQPITVTYGGAITKLNFIICHPLRTFWNVWDHQFRKWQPKPVQHKYSYTSVGSDQNKSWQNVQNVQNVGPVIAFSHSPSESIV